VFSSPLAYQDDALRFSDVPRSGNRRLTLLKLFPTRPSRSFLWLGITALDKGPGQQGNDEQN
jgi:hypothetical protein